MMPIILYIYEVRQPDQLSLEFSNHKKCFIIPMQNLNQCAMGLHFTAKRNINGFFMSGTFCKPKLHFSLNDLSICLLKNGQKIDIRTSITLSVLNRIKMRKFLNDMTAGSTVQMLATHNRRIFCPIICDTDLCRCNFFKLRTLVDTPPTRNSNPPTRGDSPLCSRAINTSNPTTVEDYIAHYPNIPNIPPPLT